VQLRKDQALQLEQEAKKEEEEDDVEDYHPLGDDGESILPGEHSTSICMVPPGVWPLSGCGNQGGQTKEK